ncbi:cytochrome c oxidase assembly protein [Cellulomonas composti]|uniref:ABC transporter permease n=1 Tax=Cellulomonas composti TaxID=266130 RepID=A0A511JE38_9CELL|nr:cytochrome c oxidase assembly protein [Cellulomonas composti]GEL96059.1 ABC transporter permease [Cellulomonas composti]
MTAPAAPATVEPAAAGPTTRARRPAWFVVALVVAGVAAVVAGVWFTGAATTALLRDPGAAVRWGLPVAATLTELAGALTVGALVLAVAVLPRRAGSDETAARTRRGVPVADGRAYPRSLVVAAGAAAAWTLLSVLHLVLTYANVAGQPLDAPTFGDQLWLFVSDIEMGRTLATAALVAALVTVGAALSRTPTGAAWTAALALVALWQQAQLGHVAGAAGHALAMSSMVLHLVGAAVWVGALAALAVLVGRLGADLVPSAARYSVIAGWCLAAVAASGVVNSVVRLSSWSDLTTRYGLLVLAKIAFTAALAGLGLLHRRRTLRAMAGAPRVTGLFWRLVLVELLVMGAVSGVAVALGASAPPVPDVPPVDQSPAYQITGHPLPPPLTPVRWLTEWRWDVLLAAAVVAGIVVYWRWALRLARRGDRWPWARTASWTAGLLLFGWATNGGAATYGHILFSAHMVQHMVLAMVVPIFLVLAAPVTLALRALPVRSAALAGDVSRGPREWILVLVHSHVGQFFAHPLVAAANFVGSMIAFYYTGLFEWSLRSPVGHLFMVVHFSLVGYLFVNALIGIDPGPRRPPYPQRLLLLFATMAFHAFFGVALVSTEQLFVADWFGLMGRPWGPSAIADQQTGGAITWGIGEIPTLALAIALAISWARDDERTARNRDRRVDRDGDAELDEYNRMLADLDRRD